MGTRFAPVSPVADAKARGNKPQRPYKGRIAERAQGLAPGPAKGHPSAIALHRGPACLLQGPELTTAPWACWASLRGGASKAGRA